MGGKISLKVSALTCCNNSIIWPVLDKDECQETNNEPEDQREITAKVAEQMDNGRLPVSGCDSQKGDDMKVYYFR